MKEFDRFSFPRNYSGKVPLFFRKFPEKFRRKFPEISDLTTLLATTLSDNHHSHSGKSVSQHAIYRYYNMCKIAVNSTTFQRLIN